MKVKKEPDSKKGKKILISIEPQEYRAAVVVDGKLDELFVERPDDNTIVGNVYKGKVDSVVQSVGAYFVEIGLGKKGFLYIKDVKNDFHDEEIERINGQQKKEDRIKNLKKGDEILVQVEKEPFSTKGARLTSQISIPGKYLVLTPDEHGISISRKIEDVQERNRLRQIMKEMSLPDDIGFIIRTAALGKQKKDLIRDVNFLIAVWSRIKKMDKRHKAPSLIHEEYDLPLRVIRDVYAEDIDKIIVNDKNYYRNISRFVKTYMPHLSKRISLEQEDIPLFEKEGIESQIESLHEPKIWLKCGGYIIIEPTEGLLVIDVNSGRFKDTKTQEETALSVNLEAAAEIARQLRLRDIGGLIVIDFIDMSKDSHRRRLINYIKDCLSRDRAKTEILGISRFGILEMARQRVRRTLESIYYQNCPYCKGRGKVKSGTTMASHVLRELKQHLNTRPKPNVISVKVHPQVKEVLEGSFGQTLHYIQRHFHKRVELIADPAMHSEEMLIA